MEMETVTYPPQTLIDADSLSRVAVDVTDTQNHFPGLDREQITALVRRTLDREGIAAAEISVYLVDDRSIREINGQHLNHDWETDVITFPLSEPGESPLAGELIISVEMAMETARSVGADPWSELALYLTHGLLHLVGYDDLSREDSEAMRQREAYHLESEGLTNTFGLVDASDSAAGREGEPCPA